MEKIASRTIALLLALAAAPAQAVFEGVDAGLIAERARLDLDDGVETRTSRITLFLAEPVRPWLTLGLHGGPVLLTQSDNPATAGLELTGYHIGVSARAEAFRTEPLGIVGGLVYTYQRTDRDETAGDVVLTLHEARAELAGVARLASLQVQLGGYALHVDGEQTVSGSTPSSRTVEAEETFGGFLQTDFLVDATGRIGLRVEAGAREAIALTFARQF